MRLIRRNHLKGAGQSRAARTPSESGRGGRQLVRVKSKMVSEIIAVFERKAPLVRGQPNPRNCDQVLSFDLLCEEIGARPSSIAGVLSSYPSFFYKVKDGMWGLIPDGMLSPKAIRDLYGISKEVLDELKEGSNKMRYSWIVLESDNRGRFNRREVHYLLHHWRKGQFRKAESPSATESAHQ